MYKRELTSKEVDTELKFEDRCGVNSLLQDIACIAQEGKEVKIIGIFNDKDEFIKIIVEEKK